MLINLSSPPSIISDEELLAKINNFLELKEESSSMAVTRKGEPMWTAFMPSGICSDGIDRAIFVFVPMLLKLLLLYSDVNVWVLWVKRKTLMLWIR